MFDGRSHRPIRARLPAVRHTALRMRIVIVGGGNAGLGTARACARDGDEVTILDRDDTPMPPTADAAFSWERTGVPQVRHSHAFLARLRNLLRDRAPDVIDA